MLFNIEADSGSCIQGYLVPDDFSSVPTLRVCAHGEERYRFPANEKREALVGAGRHETGQCGFTLDTHIIPELAELADLELFDANTDVLVYRRPSPSNIKKKLIRLETHFFPLWTLDSALAPRFQYFAKGIENLGRETVTQLFLLNHVESIYLSGKLLYKNFSYFIESGFQTLVVLQDPYEELAERLLVLSRIRKLGTTHFGMRESAALEPAMIFAEGLPMRDEKALRRAFRQMPDAVTALITNPLLRQLTTSSPDEMPTGGALAAALDILANSALVGLRHQPTKFMNGLVELLELDATSLPQMPKFDTVGFLAQMLRNSSDVNSLLEKDLELYQFVEDAFNRSQ